LFILIYCINKPQFDKLHVMSGKKLAGISLSAIEKSYQLIISRLDGLKIADPSYRNRQLQLADKGISGFIIFGGLRDAIKEFISEAQARARIPLFISSDIERGVGQQIEGMTLFPAQMSVAAAIQRSVKGDVDLLRDALLAIASEAKEIGINLAFTPVLDINSEPDNPIICTRAFSDDPELVSWFGKLYIETFEKAGIMSCGKHFPGHGSTAVDSHIELPVILKSKDELDVLDLVPFREAIKSGVSCIMTGHLSVPALDSKPASLSGIIINGLLRQELGFDGLILTDALNMHALKAFGAAGLECLKAGADILLHPEDADDTASSILNAIADKTLDPVTLDSAVTRILKKKTMLPAQLGIASKIETHKLLSNQLSQNSITLLKNSAGILPLTENNVRLIISGDDKYFDTSVLRQAFSTMEVEDANINEDDILVMAIFTNVSAWHGSSGIDGSEKYRLNAIIKKTRRSIIVSFGSPYILRHFDEAGILVAAYEPTIQAQQSALNCLTGRALFKGKLPVRMQKE
jgi:beta-N-acetylhexosaminidase